MLFDDLLKNPVVQKAVAAGEEQAGRVVGRLLASERVTNGLQGLIAAASTARSVAEATVQRALQAANLPRADEVASLKRKVDELEALLDDLAARLDAAPPAAPGSAPPAEGGGEPEP